MSDSPVVTIRTIEGDYPLSPTTSFANLVAKWGDVLRNRELWSRTASTRSDLQHECQADLKVIGLDPGADSFRRIANAGLIEVRLDGSNRTTDPWYLPWEFLLSSATETLRSQPLLVIRHLDSTDSALAPQAIPERLVVVKSNPDFLGNIYSEKSLRIEEDNVSQNLALHSKPDLLNVTLEEFTEALKSESPNVIHLAGVDAIQMAYLRAPKAPRTSFSYAEEGFVLKGQNDSPSIIPPQVLAQALCSSEECSPTLVSFNFYNSVGLAARAILAGAQHSLSFQNDIDDILSEIFFSNFYLAWRLSHWKVLDAFRLAWSDLNQATEAQRLRGAGVVLWSRQSLLDREKLERTRLKRKTTPSQASTELRD